MKPLLLFFSLAYIGARLVFVPLVVLHGPLVWTALATATPTLAAVVTQRITSGNYRAVRLIGPWPRTAAAALVGVLLMMLAYVALPGMTAAEPDRLHWSALASVSVYNYSTLLGGPLGEEPGWRGYALP